MSEQITPAPNCPFYGCFTSLTLLGSGPFARQELRLTAAFPDQCGLKLVYATRCDLQARKRTVDWQTCPLMAHARRPSKD